MKAKETNRNKKNTDIYKITDKMAQCAEMKLCFSILA